MATITEPALVLSFIDANPKLINMTVTGSTVKIETKAEYLARVSKAIRQPAMSVIFVEPAESFDISVFETKIASATSSTWQFGTNPTDASFSKVANTADLVAECLRLAKEYADQKIATTKQQVIEAAATETKAAASAAQTAAQEYVDLKIKGITTSSNVGSSVDNSAKFTVVVIPENIADIQNIQLEIPHFKYNKKLAYSLTRDDSHPATYRQDSKYINGQWVNDDITILDSENRGAGFYPSRILCSTDGCGNDIRFRMTTAYLTAWNADGTFKAPVSNSKAYLNPTELVTFTDFFGDIMNHGGDAYNNEFMLAIQRTADFIKSAVGRQPIALAQPDGEVKWLTASKKRQDIYFYTDNLIKYDPFNAADSALTIDDLYKLAIDRRAHANFSTWLADINVASSLVAAHEACVSDDSKRLWLIAGGHPFTDGGTNCRQALDYIYDHYGKGGDDSIWFAGVSEIYEYLYTRMLMNDRIVRREGTIRTVINGVQVTKGCVYFDIDIPKIPYFSWRELSFLASGLTGNATIETIGEVIKTSSSVANGSALINVDYDPKSIYLADKFLRTAESTPTDDNIKNAVYFVNRLDSVVGMSYYNRLAKLIIAPTIVSVVVNSGAVSTASTTVNAVINYTGSATHYRVTEGDNIELASWIPISSSLPYTFINQNVGTKTLSYQLKNSVGYSNIYSTHIDYVGAIIGLSSMIINNGDQSTNSATVNVKLNVVNTTPTAYRIGETADLSGAEWLQWTSDTVQYTFASKGNKKLYAEVKDDLNTSAIVNASIVYSTVTLSSLILNNGDQSTTNQLVSVALSYNSEAIEYMLSESSSFAGASWIPISPTVSFTLSTGSATKRVYGKARDANGIESAVVYGEIVYSAGFQGKKAIVSICGASNSIQIVQEPGIGKITYVNLSAVTDKKIYLDDTQPTNTGWFTQGILTYIGTPSSAYGFNGTTYIPTPNTIFANTVANTTINASATPGFAVSGGHVRRYSSSSLASANNSSCIYSFNLTGLTVGRTMKFKFFGSRSGSYAGPFTTRYRVLSDGVYSDWQTLTVSGNTSNFAEISGIIVPASGTVTIQLGCTDVIEQSGACLQVYEVEEIA